MTQEIKKVVRDGKVAVLYSPGFGAGWSTWNSEYPQMLFDPEIVDFLEKATPEQMEWREEEIEKRFQDKYPDAYFGGARDLKIEWVPQGTAFYVSEYDGSESIKYGPNDFIIA